MKILHDGPWDYRPKKAGGFGFGLDLILAKDDFRHYVIMTDVKKARIQDFGAAVLNEIRKEFPLPESLTTYSIIADRRPDRGRYLKLTDRGWVAAGSGDVRILRSLIEGSAERMRGDLAPSEPV